MDMLVWFGVIDNVSRSDQVRSTYPFVAEVFPSHNPVSVLGTHPTVWQNTLSFARTSVTNGRKMSDVRPLFHPLHIHPTVNYGCSSTIHNQDYVTEKNTKLCSMFSLSNNFSQGLWSQSFSKHFVNVEDSLDWIWDPRGAAQALQPVWGEIVFVNLFASLRIVQW